LANELTRALATDLISKRSRDKSRLGGRHTLPELKARVR